MVTKAEQSNATRQALVAAARPLFAEHGFADTSTEAVVQAAGVTRGALYHQFRDKTALFEAVYEDLEQSLMHDVVRAVKDIRDPMLMLRRGSQAFLDACLDPAILRVVLIEAPTVLGWQRWREIDMEYGLGMVIGALQWAQSEGVIERTPVMAMAHVLLGGLMEGALVMAYATDRVGARDEVGAAIDTLIDGLSPGWDKAPDLAPEPAPPAPKRVAKAAAGRTAKRR
jgi:AcrR family transcriptional regulator